MADYKVAEKVINEVLQILNDTSTLRLASERFNLINYIKQNVTLLTENEPDERPILKKDTLKKVSTNNNKA